MPRRRHYAEITPLVARSLRCRRADISAAFDSAAALLYLMPFVTMIIFLLLEFSRQHIYSSPLLLILIFHLMPPDCFI